MARRALFTRLTEACRVTLISAPAGSGKTQLVRSWIEAEGLADRAAWFTIAGGQDLMRFCVGVNNALRSTTAGSAAIRGVTAAPDLNCELLAERLLEDLEQPEERMWLAIDDVQELRPELLRQLELFIMRAPPTLRLILLTRHDVPLGLHRLRLEGELTEIRAADLCFGFEEARALFESAGVQLSDSAVRSLHERTEGWAAGLRLAAMSLVGHPDPERFAAEFSGTERTVAEFLMAEVLERQPPETKRLLLATSVLERVNGELGDALTDSSGSEAILHRLEDANAFVVSLDAARTWFRCHRLFADLLALELRRSASEAIPGLHATAARWFARHGFTVSAIRHFQAARDWQSAARLLYDCWVDFRLEGRDRIARELLMAFPGDVVAADAELNSLMGDIELLGGSLDEAERYVAIATSQAGSIPASRRAQFDVRLMFRGFRLARRRGDLSAVLAAAAELLAPPQSARLSADLRAVLVNELGIAELWSLRIEEAQQHLREALTLAEEIGRPHIETNALSHLAILSSFLSSEVASDYATRAIEIAERNGWSDAPVVGMAYLANTTTMMWRGRLSDAEGWLGRARRSVTVAPDPAAGLLLHHAHGLIELAGARYEKALEAFRTNTTLSQRVVREHSLVIKTQAMTLHTRLRLGETERVAHALGRLDDSVRDLAEFRLVAVALALDRDEPELAAEQLAPILDGSHPMMLPRAWAIQPRLFEAKTCHARGDPGGTERALEHALAIAEPHGTLLPFLLHPVPDLLERYARVRGGHGSLVREILGLYAGRAPVSSAANPDTLTEALSDSELRVLRYLPTHLSLKEIGDELFVSVNTVKVHVRHLYAKLDVHGRNEAIERARALGLLAQSLHGR